MAIATQTLEQSAPVNQNSTANTVLAGRGSRLIATVIDSLMMSAVSVPSTIALVMMGIPAIVSGIVGMAVGITLFSVLNFRLLENAGQTFGKRAMGIRILSDENNLLPAKELLLKRYLPLWGVAAIPFIGGLLAIANAVLIFGATRKCGHDMIAGTKVVDAK